MLDIIKAKCKDCEVENMYEDMIKHKKICQKKTICVIGCGEYVSSQNFIEHMGKCKFMMMFCKKCGDTIKREEIKEHICINTI